MYVRFEIVSGSDFFVCSINFRLLQSDGTGGFDGGTFDLVPEEGGDDICDDITADQTFLVEPNSGDDVDLTKPVEVYYDTGKVILIHVFPGPSSIIPVNGIWQSSDPPLSIYIQKYQAASAIAVATQDGINLVAFLDSNIADGFSQDQRPGKSGIRYIHHPSGQHPWHGYGGFAFRRGDGQHFADFSGSEVVPIHFRHENGGRAPHAHRFVFFRPSAKGVSHWKRRGDWK